MNYQFHIQGSAEEPYLVEFRYTKTKFRAACTCPAGYKKMLCKHISTILEGEIPPNLVGGDDVSKIPFILNAFHNSEVKEIYDLFLTITNEVDLLKKEATNRKRQFARMLYQ